MTWNQWRSQNAEKVTHIKRRLLDQSVVFLIASLFKMGTSLKGKNSLPLGGSEFFPLRAVPYDMENHFNQIRWPPLNIPIIITHVRNCIIVMGATPMWNWLDELTNHFIPSYDDFVRHGHKVWCGRQTVSCIKFWACTCGFWNSSTGEQPILWWASVYAHQSINCSQKQNMEVNVGSNKNITDGAVKHV